MIKKRDSVHESCVCAYVPWPVCNICIWTYLLRKSDVFCNRVWMSGLLITSTVARDLESTGLELNVSRSIDLRMGWLRLVGSLKLQVSFAEHRLFYRALLQKRHWLLRSLLIVATPHMSLDLPWLKCMKVKWLSCKFLDWHVSRCLDWHETFTYMYGVATVSRFLKIIDHFQVCRIWSLL